MADAVRKVLEDAVAPSLAEAYDQIRAHLRGTHCNDAALDLTDQEAVNQHFAEHNGESGLRDHDEPTSLHDFRGVNYVMTIRPDGVAPENVTPTPAPGSHDELEGIMNRAFAGTFTSRDRPALERTAFALWKRKLTREEQFSHCGNPKHHLPHRHDIHMTGEYIPDTPCVGTPDFASREPELNPFVREGSGGWTRGPSGPGEFDEQYLRALRPGSQPLPTTSDREGAHDALLREHLAAALTDRKLLGLTRYHSLLQAGNGRDSLRDATEEVLDLAAYLHVWTQARDEALELLSELRVALVSDRAIGEDPVVREHVETIRKIEHLLGGGTL